MFSMDVWYDSTTRAYSWNNSRIKRLNQNRATKRAKRVQFDDVECVSEGNRNNFNFGLDFNRIFFLRFEMNSTKLDDDYSPLRKEEFFVWCFDVSMK